MSIFVIVMIIAFAWAFISIGAGLFKNLLVPAAKQIIGLGFFIWLLHTIGLV